MLNQFKFQGHVIFMTKKDAADENPHSVPTHLSGKTTRRSSATPSTPIISVAPMMDWTDRHCRYFHRLIAPSLTLYTEMVTTGALLFGDVDRHLRFDENEHPVVLQLGGSDPQALAKSAKLGEDYGYDEINLNCGCPSNRVQSGSFGACLMNEPDLVATCIKAMQDVVSIPVHVKCRIGIDDSEDYTFLRDFVETVSTKGGCQTFVIHARKAWLKGLSPKENREIPPLQYDIVHRIKADFPHLDIQINGGFKTLDDIKVILDTEQHPPACGHGAVLNGVMIGREAYQNPWFLRTLEEHFFHTKNLPSAHEVALLMIPYMKNQQEKYDTPIKSVTRHMTGLFQGQAGARSWRQFLSTQAHLDTATPDIIEKALDHAFS